jgi:hypothetical protein
MAVQIGNSQSGTIGLMLGAACGQASFEAPSDVGPGVQPNRLKGVSALAGVSPVWSQSCAFMEGLCCEGQKEAAAKHFR